MTYFYYQSTLYRFHFINYDMGYAHINNISVLMEETGVPEQNHRHVACHRRTECCIEYSRQGRELNSHLKCQQQKTTPKTKRSLYIMHECFVWFMDAYRHCSAIFINDRHFQQAGRIF